MNKLITIEYYYGFTLFGVLYCWKDKELYRMPFTRSLRSYLKIRLKIKTIGKQKGYQIAGAFYSLNDLKRMTASIRHSEIEYISDGLPF